MKSHFVEYIKFAKGCWWNNGIGNFICYITWKKWNFIHKFPPKEILLTIWRHKTGDIIKINKMGSLHASPKWSFSGKEMIELNWIIKFHNKSYNLKPYNFFCNSSIFEYPNEIGDFESLCNSVLRSLLSTKTILL